MLISLGSFAQHWGSKASSEESLLQTENLAVTPLSPNQFVFSSQSVTLNIWDPENKPGQVISISLNEESNLLISGLTVTSERMTIDVFFNMGSNILYIHADEASSAQELIFDVQMTDGISLPQKKVIKVEQNKLDPLLALIR